MDKDLSGRIQSVDRAMMILEALGSFDSGCRLTDLSKATGLSLTTAHRLLTTLQQRRFVQFSKGENLWFVGAGAYAVGSSFFKDRSIVASAAPFLRRLRDQAGETANIGIVEDGQILLADQAKAKDSCNAISAIGARTPMSASGMGKAFLASYHPDEVVALTRKQGLNRITSKSLTSIDALGRELKRIEAQGYSLDDEEYRVGLRCVAAPVYNDRHEVVCALSVSGSSRRITAERLSSLAQFVKDVASDFTLHLGGKVYR
ncbi:MULTISPECIES: IclR family transcriptional regulator [unclassified Rhizobium]|uniref:IclR family transcriptional regulator n=1 Tax=unclassified Rhizobium TaxID=2613769 RepID=UPI001ADB49E8|nr:MULTISPECIES: IclR family transcriptional regulator C-terminal domain-containing protein [unclassified Rhizobium]MBO9123808.1 helix-turn-helix domain-containing protein [Rhizobium sp. 16-488-2b]MBO9174340.1 helix-turn-helix domain-containing protein [Rhizobium sp. 16-488-2a]